MEVKNGKKSFSKKEASLGSSGFLKHKKSLWIVLNSGGKRLPALQQPFLLAIVFGVCLKKKRHILLLLLYSFIDHEKHNRRQIEEKISLNKQIGAEQQDAGKRETTKTRQEEEESKKVLQVGWIHSSQASTAAAAQVR